MHFFPPFDNHQASAQSGRMNLSELSVAALKRIVEIKGQIEVLEAQLSDLNEADPAQEASKPGRRTMSAAARRKIAAAQRARWARVKGTEEAPKPKKRRMSAAGRAAISAATKARWAKARAAK
jgi:hypothetical protein